MNNKINIRKDSRTEDEKTNDFEEYFKNDPNNFSNWFPKIENSFKKFNINYLSLPRSIIIPIPVEIMKMLFEPVKYLPQIQKFVHEEIMPKIPNDMFFLFMKNGTFSNKYNFNENCKCRRNELEVTNSFININYGAACCDAGGVSEIIIRDFIGNWNWLEENIAFIYNGMPLRPEFRVFYDFDTKKVMYSVNYWDYDYCHESIERKYTDEIVYDKCYFSILNFYEKYKNEVEQLVADSIKIVNGLSGKWSVDVMWDDESQKYWLIDMATAETSAYYKEK